MKKHKDTVIVWPAYLDANLTRARGRRIPANLAAPDVTVEMLEAAADAAGFESEVAPDKRYPRNWSGNSGQILLKNQEGHKKKRLLLVLAKGVRRVAAQRESERQAAEIKKTKKKRR